MIAFLLALACFPVDGPRLLARHLAAAVPAFAQIAPETDFGYAPRPGAARVLRSDELQRLGSSHGIEVQPAPPVCFDWKLQPIEPAQASEAMRASLPPEAQLEVVALSRFPVPPGEMVFPIGGLRSGFWRGHVQYGEDARFDIWARVRVSVKQTRVVAAVTLKGGDRLGPDHLSVEEFESAPGHEFITRVEDALGMITKRPFAAGTPIPLRMLEKPADVKRGDPVRLHSRIGSASVSTEAYAQSAGKVGDWIPVKNASSGRVVRARVEAAGEVTLTP
jgi:flagella basal body P-ring formation protein FlgA